MYRSTRSALTAVALAAAVAGSTAAVAGADTTAAAGLSTHTEKRSPAKITRHWTGARMRHAKPMALPGLKGTRPAVTRRSAPGGEPGAVEGSKARLRRSGGRTRAPGGTFAQSSFAGLELPWNNTSYGFANPISSVGRLFYRGYDRRTNSWFDSYCTGTLVAANVVLTAAHCVREGRPDGVKFNSFSFVPAVNGTSRPYGSFTGRNFTTMTNWYSAPYYNSAGTGGGGYYGQDYAFVTLNKNAAGRNAGDLTGWYGIYFNAPNTAVYHLGYPGEGNWQGCTTASCRPWQCSSPIQRYSQYVTGGKWDVGFSCYTTGGASGGPIFQQINGSWYVTSVLSHMGRVYCQNGLNPCPAGNDRFGKTFFGSYLDSDLLSAYNLARTL